MCDFDVDDIIAFLEGIQSCEYSKADTIRTVMTCRGRKCELRTTHDLHGVAVTGALEFCFHGGRCERHFWTRSEGRRDH